MEAYVGKCTNDMPYDAESSSSLYEVPYRTQHEMSVELSRNSDHEKSNIEDNLTQLQGNSADQDNLDLEIKQEKAIHTNDVFIPPSIMMIDHHPNEYETLHYPPQVEPSSWTLKKA